jgi:hypothetical protein
MHAQDHDMAMLREDRRDVPGPDEAANAAKYLPQLGLAGARQVHGFLTTLPDTDESHARLGLPTAQ